MSVSFWWIGFLITGEDHARMLPPFEEARLQAAPWRAAHAPAIEVWKAHPAALEDAVRTDNYAVNDFQDAFCLRGFEALMPLYEKDMLFRFTSIPRSPPVAVLWHALGFERATMLPGDMGNLLVPPEEVARVSDEVAVAYAGLDLSMAVAQGYRFCSGSATSAAEVKEVVTLLPDGLRRAQELGKGFLAVAHLAP